MEQKDIEKLINFAERLGLDIDDLYDAVSDYVVKKEPLPQCPPNCPQCTGQLELPLGK